MESRLAYYNQALFYESPAELSAIEQMIDAALSNEYGFSYYTEFEWGQYGYEPPEGHDVVSAWRHQDTEVYITLLLPSKKVGSKAIKKLVLTIVGIEKNIDKYKKLFALLKRKYSNKRSKEVTQTETSNRLDRISKSKHYKYPVAIVSVITVITNAFSLYLRKIPPPSFSNQNIATAYNITSECFNFLSVLALSLLMLLCISVIIRYGILWYKSL